MESQDAEMTTRSKALENLRLYSKKIHSTEHDSDPSIGKPAYEVRLNQTLEDLNRQVSEQKAALEKVSISSFYFDHITY